MSESCFDCKKHQIWSKNYFFALCQNQEWGHKQFYFQMWKYFCRHLHSSLISMFKSHCWIGKSALPHFQRLDKPEKWWTDEHSSLFCLKEECLMPLTPDKWTWWTEWLSSRLLPPGPWSQCRKQTERAIITFEKL